MSARQRALNSPAAIFFREQIITYMVTCL
jgi:hypothetical protein